MKKNTSIIILIVCSFIFVGISTRISAQDLALSSPNGKIDLELFCRDSKSTGSWYLRVNYKNDTSYSVVIPSIDLGLTRQDAFFSDNLRLVRVKTSSGLSEQYEMIHGKKKLCTNEANQAIAQFENHDKQKLNLVLRVYNDGIAFQYEFPSGKDSCVITDEMTSYAIPDNHNRWLEEWSLANEELYVRIDNPDIQNNWAYPALFSTSDSMVWYLIHEADVNRSYCATKLSNINNSSIYEITLPAHNEGEGEGSPAIALPWKSPWRVIIIGQLKDIVESTLVNDVSTPTKMQNTSWIKPGLVSWNYWSHNHGTKDFQIVCEFADLAATMNWPYTLLDWEWDQMENGGDVADATKYILSKGVKPLIWYNAGVFKWIQSTPVDRMLTHENRTAEFAKLKEMGIAGVKVDFFLNEKQDMINYYLDILEDAADYEIMVYFHGCLVPRGWARTYPHLMTYEGVRGAEWYNNGPEFTPAAPVHNTILPFTRNVVGAMDYTPVTFTNSQFPHLTSYGHELALSVIFESGLQHMADRPSAYYELPFEAQTFLKKMPAAWDDTKLIDGYPGKHVIIARQKGHSWYVGGISSEDIEKNLLISFAFLPEGVKYRLTLIQDGDHDKEFAIHHKIVDSSSIIEVEMLRRGGFTAFAEPLDE